MKIFLTGATGFIGFRLAARLVNDGYSVTALVRPSSETQKLSDVGVTLFVWDGRVESLTGLFQQEQFSGMIHLAAMYRSVHQSEDILDLMGSNVTMPAMLMEAAVSANKPWVLNTGTVWQHFQGESYNPVNLYAATKQATEDVARFYVEEFGLRLITLKISDTYGPGDVRPKLLNLWLRQTDTDAPMEMSGGEQLIDLVHINDVLDAFALAVRLLACSECGKNAEGFFVSSGSPLTLREFARIFEEVSGRALSIRWGVKPYRKREIFTPCKSLPVLPGWTPKVFLREGLSALLREKEWGG